MDFSLSASLPWLLLALGAASLILCIRRWSTFGYGEFPLPLERPVYAWIAIWAALFSVFFVGVTLIGNATPHGIESVGLNQIMFSVLSLPFFLAAFVVGFIKKPTPNWRRWSGGAILAALLAFEGSIPPGFLICIGIGFAAVVPIRTLRRRSRQLQHHAPKVTRQSSHHTP